MVWTIFSLLNEETGICTTWTWPNNSRVCQLVHHHPSPLEFHIPPTNIPGWRAGFLFRRLRSSHLAGLWCYSTQHRHHSAQHPKTAQLGKAPQERGVPPSPGLIKPTTALGRTALSMEKFLTTLPMPLVHSSCSWWICQDWDCFSKDWSKPKNSVFVQIKLVAGNIKVKKK